MAPEARTEIIQILEKTRQEFNNAVRDCAESQAKAHPEEGRWSVLDCVEHVTSVEERFLGRLEQAQRLETPHVDKEKEADILARVASRVNKVQAPEPVRPVGRFASLAQALEQFNTARARTMQFAEQRGNDLYLLSADHPRFGTMNGSEWMMFIAAHGRRHAEQIREVRAALAKA